MAERSVQVPLEGASYAGSEIIEAVLYKVGDRPRHFSARLVAVVVPTSAIDPANEARLANGWEGQIIAYVIDGFVYAPSQVSLMI